MTSRIAACRAGSTSCPLGTGYTDDSRPRQMWLIIGGAGVMFISVSPAINARSPRAPTGKTGPTSISASIRDWLNRDVFVIIWRYSVAANRESDFRSVYGPQGEWNALFRSASGYLGTELVDCDEPGSYITVDRWEDKSQFDKFIDEFRTEYRGLDLESSAMTISEELIGQGWLDRNGEARLRST
jgi:heme-degrading monooxygenase HmoA